MPCIDLRRWALPAAAVAAILFGALAGCSLLPTEPRTEAAPVVQARPVPSAPRSATPPPPPPLAAAPRAPAPALRSWDDFRTHAARRLVEANPQGSYMGVPPEPLLAIPVLEVELNADGSVRHINVLRVPSQAKDTVQIAIDAVRRAAPFAAVAHLPRPWKFTEVFLFDDNRRFKPRTLDL